MPTPSISTWLRGGCLAVLIAVMPLAVTGSGSVAPKAACAEEGTCAPEAGSYCVQDDGGMDVNWRPVYNAAK